MFLSICWHVFLPVLLLESCGRGSGKKNQPAVPPATEGSIYGKLKTDSGDITQSRIELKQNGRNMRPMLNPNPTGDYEFNNLKSGLYEVEASMPGKISVTHEVFLDPGEKVAVPPLQLLSLVVIPNTGTVAGSLNLPAYSTAGITLAVVSLLQGSTETARVNPDGSGNYRFINVAPGAYTVQVSLAGFEREVATVTVTGGGVTTIPAIDLLATTGIAEGSISLPAYSTADITLAVVSLLQGSTETARVNPDGSGNYRFTNVAPGAYTVQVSLAGFDDASSSSFDVIARDVTTADAITMLPNTGTVAGSLSLPAGSAADIRTAIVILLQGSTETARVNPDVSGSYNFPLVDPGSYTVQVSLAVFTLPPACPLT